MTQKTTIYSEDDMRRAFVAGIAAGKYRGQITAAERMDALARKSASTTFDKWMIYADSKIGTTLAVTE